MSNRIETTRFSDMTVSVLTTEQIDALVGDYPSNPNDRPVLVLQLHDQEFVAIKVGAETETELLLTDQEILLKRLNQLMTKLVTEVGDYLLKGK